MQDLKQREDKIKEKRIKTPRRDFLKEICSQQRLTFYKNNDIISRYPETQRVKNIIKGANEYDDMRENFTKYGIDYDFSKDFFINMK